MITQLYTTKLGFKICAINIRAQKIDSFTFETFDIVLASFQVKDKLGRDRFFQNIFLVADTSIEVILRMPFLALSNADVSFTKRELI